MKLKFANVARNFLMMAGSGLIALVIAEIVLRITGTSAVYLRPRVDVVIPHPEGPYEEVPYGFVPLATIRSIYASNPRGYFDSGNSIDHVFNSLGWRDVEHTIRKSPNTFRILGLGDSYLFGQGVRREDICLTRLGELLEDRSSKVSIETINAGISAYNTAQQRDLLVERGLEYDPDLVIVHFVLNDVEPDVRRPGPKIEFFREYQNTYMVPDALSRYSHLWAWTRQQYVRRVRGSAYIRECLDNFLSDKTKWTFCSSALDDLHRICASEGIGLLVVIFPFFYNLDGDYPFQPIHDRVRSHCESAGIAVLDLRDHYRKYRGPELWVHPTDQHPNEIAHAVAARAIAEYLKRHRVVFGLYQTRPGP